VPHFSRVPCARGGAFDFNDPTPDAPSWPRPLRLEPALIEVEGVGGLLLSHLPYSVTFPSTTTATYFPDATSLN